MLELGIVKPNCQNVNSNKNGFTRFTAQNGTQEFMIDYSMCVFIYSRVSSINQYLLHPFFLLICIIHNHGIVRIFHLKIHEKYIQQQKHISKDHIVVGNTYSHIITIEIACRSKFITYIKQNLLFLFSYKQCLNVL